MELFVKHGYILQQNLNLTTIKTFHTLYNFLGIDTWNTIFNKKLMKRPISVQFGMQTFKQDSQANNVYHIVNNYK